MGWEGSSPWTQGRSLQSEYQNRGLESETKDPRRGGKGETPKSGRAQGPGQKQASSRLTHRQVGRKTSREAPEQGGLSAGPLLQTTGQQQQNKVGTNI